MNKKQTYKFNSINEIIKLLKFRGVSEPRKGQSINKAVIKSGGFELTKAEKVAIELMK